MFMCVPVLSLHESVRVAKNAMKNASEVSTPKQATIATGTNGMTLEFRRDPFGIYTYVYNGEIEIENIYKSEK